MAQQKLSDLEVAAYRLSPALWADRELKPRVGIDLDQWQRGLVMANRGSRQCVLTFRQSGKSTAAAVAIAHSMIFRPGSTSLAIAPKAGHVDIRAAARWLWRRLVLPTCAQKATGDRT